MMILKLFENEVGDEGVKALSTSTNLANLDHLDLYMNLLGDDRARAIASSNNL